MRPKEMDKMSAAETNARHWLDFVETRDAARLGVERPLARARLAQRIGQAPGTLENLGRGRLKRTCAALVEGLRLEFCRAVSREIGTLQHELDMARACGRSDADMGEIETHLAALREILARRKGPDLGVTHGE
jgi:transcriptional regulator GlxA family with amidase domain